MSEKNSGALYSLQLTLARWKAPSAWDVVNRDEPLDPAPPGEWESNYGANVTSNGTITIPAGTAMSNAGGQFFITTNYSSLEMRMASMIAEEDARVFRALNEAAGLGTRAPGQNGGPSTAYGRGNEPFEPVLPDRVPYPRNHKERRILRSISNRLPELIRRAEKKHGRRHEVNSKSTWNDEFWKMVTHDHGAGERRKSKK